MSKWMNKKTNEWLKKVKRKNGCNKDIIFLGKSYELIDEWIKKWMNEWTNE